MKINKYIGWAVCSLLMASCQNDEAIVEQPVESGKYTLIGQINNEEFASRAQIELGCADPYTEYFFWNEGDRFALYQNLDGQFKKSEFVISEDYDESDGGATNAEFSSSDGLTPLANYVAVYPYDTEEGNNIVSFSFPKSIDFSAAKTDAERADVWKAYFNKYMYMIGSGTLSETGRNFIKFQHQCVLARITYTNQTGSEQAISGFRLGGDQYFGLNMSYNMLDNSSVVDISTLSYTVDLKGLTVADGASVDLYAFFFPETIREGNMTITIMQPQGEKTLSLPLNDVLAANANLTSFRAGMRYWFDVTDTANGLDWTKNLAEEGMIVFENKELSQILFDVLGNYKVTLTSEGYAKMSQQHVNSLNKLDFSNGDYTLTSLDGLEKFVNLRDLICNGVGLTECDLTPFKSLYTLELNDNELTSLDLSENRYLGFLSCHGNKLTELDITPIMNLVGDEALICGAQKNNQTLKLTMTEDQKNRWESSWMDHKLNKNVSYEGMSQIGLLKNAAISGGSVKLSEDARLNAPLVVEGDLTIDLNGYLLTGPFNDNDFKDPDNLKTFVAVKPGGTLTINDSKGGAQVNTGQGLKVLSCIRLISGNTDELAKVVINESWVVGTYYGILVDQDCPTPEVVINGGVVEGDFNNAYNGVGILNTGKGKVTVTGGIVKGHASAIEMQGGALNISAGQFKSTQIKLQDGPSVNPEVGNMLIGPTISIAPRRWTTVNIKGGKFETGGHCSFYEKIMDTSVQQNIGLVISGGIFESAVWSVDVTEFITGGQFKVELEPSFIAADKAAHWNGNYFVIQQKVNGGDSNGDNFGEGGEF